MARAVLGRAHVAVFGHKTATITLTLLLVLPVPTSAQEPRPPEDSPDPSPTAKPSTWPPAWELALAAGAIGASNLADLRSTQELVAAGGHEAWNPGLYGRDAERIVPVKIAVIAGETGVFLAVRRRDKKAAWVFVAVIIAINVGLTIHNRRITNRLRAEQAGLATMPPPAGPSFQISFSW
jgi:hypothetical protein